MLLLWVLGLLSVALAQSSGIPKCAQPCLLTALETRICSPLDKQCICTNEQFQANVTGCVLASCTIPDALAMRNASLTSCGAPIRDHGHSYQVLSNTLFSISGGFVVARFLYKIFLSRLDLGWDDWAVLATAVTSVPSAVVTVYGTVANGLGRDMWTLTPTQITQMLKYFYIMAALYFAEAALLKLCLTFFYLRVFPSAGVQRLLWATVGGVALWGIIFVVTALLQCRPVAYFWTKWDGQHAGACLDVNAVATTHAAISIALDVWILGIPLWQLRRLRMHWKKKLGVGFMFCVGTFVTVVSVLRLRAVVRFAASDNPSWDFYDVSVWSTIEICVGIVCACLPTVRQLLARMFPFIKGSSARSRGYCYNHEQSNELKNIGRRNVSHSATVAASNSSVVPDSPTFKESDGNGIVVETTYAVQRSRDDIDEVSLVSHSQGDEKPASSKFIM